MSRKSARYDPAADRLEGMILRHTEAVHAFSAPLSVLGDISSHLDDVMCGRCGLTVARGQGPGEFLVKYLGQGRAQPVKKIDFDHVHWPCAR